MGGMRAQVRGGYVEGSTDRACDRLECLERWPLILQARGKIASFYLDSPAQLLFDPLYAKIRSDMVHSVFFG